MAGVTPQIAIAVLIVVIIIAVWITWSVEPCAFKGSRSAILLRALAGLSLFITFLFYYSVVSLQQQEQRLAVLSTTQTVTLELVNELNAEIQIASATIPNFAFSLTPLLPCSQAYTLIPDTCSATNCMETKNLSDKIFQIWALTVLSYAFIAIQPLALITAYLQLAHSQYLLEKWYMARLNYDQSTQEYVGLLFVYGIPVTEQTPEAYQVAAQAMLNDPRYKQISFGKSTMN